MLFDVAAQAYFSGKYLLNEPSKKNHPVYSILLNILPRVGETMGDHIVTTSHKL